ncbi:hypothetical protein ACH5A7_20995 [Streptomyces sp. NPDC018955]|uniref:hypothetical protein n=1 Tax=Streptomyces sp. NPDC018955 TaxID=3365055 RepID=UPI0037BB29DB
MTTDPTPPADRATLRDRIADVLAAADGWSWVEDFDKTQSPAYRSYQSRADAVLAVLPPADQATVAARRDRIAEAALNAVESALGDTLVPAAREEALAGIAAVLPPPTDRAAIYRQLATSYERIVAAALPGDKPDWYEAIADVARGLRRMADEPPAEAEGDTLPAWLYRRFAVIHGAPDWEQLEDAARPYWERQARAVRRAVARSGIEQPAAGARQDGEA